MTKPCVFILGASGLVGKECVKLFLKKNYLVHGIARNIHNLSGEKDYTFHQLDMVHQAESFFELIKKHQPRAIIFALGNHENEASLESSKNQFSLNLDLANKLLNSVKTANLDTSILFCSSLMAYIPDRIYPAYAASKAGLNQLIQSSVSQGNKKVNISGLVLGPISSKPDKWFELSATKVANRIFNIIVKKKRGLIYLPFYGKLIALLSIIAPHYLESKLLKKRRPNAG